MLFKLLGLWKLIIAAIETETSPFSGTCYVLVLLGGNPKPS